MNNNGHGVDYFDQQFKLASIKLMPGDYVATACEPKLLVTVLGSCVAACLRDPVTGVCGMNHFMLPESRNAIAQDSLAARFGVQAMELLILDMQRKGASRERLQAKVFGAGSVLEGMNVVNVGELNAAFILNYLKVENIRMLASDLLGECARKVYFFSESGKVMIRRLHNSHESQLTQRERRYQEAIEQKADHSGSVDLFD